MELSLTGREFSAGEALEYGLVTEIAGRSLKRATDLAIQLAGHSPVGVAAGLDYVTRFAAAIGNMREGTRDPRPPSLER